MLQCLRNLSFTLVQTRVLERDREPAGELGRQREVGLCERRALKLTTDRRSAEDRPACDKRKQCSRTGAELFGEPERLAVDVGAAWRHDRVEQLGLPRGDDAAQRRRGSGVSPQLSQAAHQRLALGIRVAGVDGRHLLVLTGVHVHEREVGKRRNDEVEERAHATVERHLFVDPRAQLGEEFESFTCTPLRVQQHDAIEAFGRLLGERCDQREIVG